MTKRTVQRNAVGLTPHEQRFVDEYLIDFNAKDALVRMGFTGKAPKETAHQIRHRPHVDAEIERGMQRLHNLAVVRREDVIERYRRIAFGNIQDVIVVNEDGTQNFDVMAIPREKADLIDAVEFSMVAAPKAKKGKKPKGQIVGTVKVKMADRLRALDKLGQHLGLFRDDQVSVTPVTFIITGLYDEAHPPKPRKPLPPLIDAIAK